MSTFLSTLSLMSNVNCQNVGGFSNWYTVSAQVLSMCCCYRCNCYLSCFSLCFCRWWMIRWLRHVMTRVDGNFHKQQLRQPPPGLPLSWLLTFGDHHHLKLSLTSLSNNTGIFLWYLCIFVFESWYEFVSVFVFVFLWRILIEYSRASQGRLVPSQ